MTDVTHCERARRSRLPVGVCAYGFSYRCGFAGAGTGRACPAPMTSYDLMDLASAHGLSGVEFPPAWGLGRLDRGVLDEARAYARARDLFVLLDSGIVHADTLRALIPVAAALGARTIRAIISSILCGDRHAMAGTWQEYLAGIIRELRAVRPVTEDSGVAIALENHQDVTSEELVTICEQVDSPCIGVTLDAVNPLAVGEDPLVFARRVAPYIKHVHLKDYRLYRTPEGYRLARCAIGSGILDVRGLFALLAREAPQATVAIELGALEARHVRFLEDDFWPGYPPRAIQDILPVLRLRDRAARPDGEDWRTPWERGEDGEALAAFEMHEFEQSVRYLQEVGV